MLKLERYLSRRIGVWILRIKQDLQPLVLIGLTVAFVWNQIQINNKDKTIMAQQKTIYSLQQQKHVEDKEDKIFWRDAYFQILKTLKQDEKVNMDSVATIIR